MGHSHVGLIDRKERTVELLISRIPEDLSRKLQAMFIERRSSVHAKLTYAQALEAWWRFTKVDPLSANKEDIRKFLEAASKEYKETTIDLFLARIKTFVKWYRRELTDPWESIKPSRNTKRNLRDKILASEEVKALIKAAGRPKSKAIIALLYEGALRVGELSSLRIKDLEFTEYGFKIRVAGKTGRGSYADLFSAIPEGMVTNASRCPNYNINFLGYSPKISNIPFGYCPNERYDMVI